MGQGRLSNLRKSSLPKRLKDNRFSSSQFYRVYSVNGKYLTLKMNIVSKDNLGIDRVKRERLEAQGWSIGSVAEFLKLSSEEAILVEIKLALSKRLKERRQGLMTQHELATRLGSSQPRIAQAENGDASVSIEFLIRAMLATGATAQEIGQAIAGIGGRLANGLPFAHGDKGLRMRVA